VKQVIDRVDVKGEDVTASVTRVSYRTLPAAIQRHLILSDVPEMMVHLPQVN